MVCSGNDNLVVAWSDFPKGLRVLLLDKDESSAAETKLKLESMDYVVSLFCNEEDALRAISNEAENSHVAIIEVTNTDDENNLKFLELAKTLPTMVISDAQCLSTMMKCIALGAVEFSQKPLPEERLRNIWQHVVHKAFNSGDHSVLSKALKPVKETVVSMLQLQREVTELNLGCPSRQEDVKEIGEFLEPTTPTPQLPLNFSTEKRRPENTNSAENAFCNSPHTSSAKEVSLFSEAIEAALEEEVNSSAAIEACIPSTSLRKGDNLVHNPNTNSSIVHNEPCSRENKKHKKKMKVDWTPELHRKFVQAVEQVGVDQAIPSKILELMKVDGLTRYNVASHLQKYRMHRRHSLPGEDNKRRQQNRNLLPKNCMQRPLVSVPTCQTCYSILQNPMNYPVWNHPIYHHSSVHMWSNTPTYAAWQQPLPANWPCNNCHGVQADAWGCPVLPFYGQYSASTQVEEVIDKVVKEAMSKPWLPLPIGLKSPSTDSVLSELDRQSIYRIPPPAKRSSLHGTGKPR